MAQKKERILMIVESPNKTKSIKKYLPDNYVVMASKGHIRNIKNTGDHNLGIDIDDNFKATYEISPDKKDVVNKLKEQVKMADKVVLATDPDREGEAISWHLKDTLKIPQSKLQRVTYHAITDAAIKNALENPRDIDMDLVASAKTRQKIDKIMGFLLSEACRNKAGGRSAGRCQSACLRLICDRENEILNFDSMKYFDLYLYFKKLGKDYKAKYIGTLDKEIKYLSSEDECIKIENECKGKPFTITNITSKTVMDNPKPPFITSTLIQEVSKKLNIDTGPCTDYAQKLFEGIDVNGEHIALITYIRTDDANYAPEFLPVLSNKVKELYGESYYAPVKKVKAKENTQAGHEAIRPVDLEMTPEILAKYITDQRLLKIYKIIYDRTIASSMKPAMFNVTTYTIQNGNNIFVLNSRKLTYDGYRKVYNYKSDEDEDEESSINTTFEKGEILKETHLEHEEKVTQPPKRYTEASLTKELEDSGIGRPATYKSIIETILSEKRNYCVKEGKSIVPTELGLKVDKFLADSFPDIININYTAEMEKDLDLIESGKLDDLDVLTEFYDKLKESINKVSPEVTQSKLCPNCGKPLKLRYSKKTGKKFWGCSNYPNCNYIESFKHKSEK